MTITTLLSKAERDLELSKHDIKTLFNVPLFSPDYGLLLAAGRRKSIEASNGLAEVHAQIGVNIAPCPMSCQFCAFSQSNKVFTESVEFSPEYINEQAQQFEHDGANAIYLMCTADFSFQRFLDIAEQVKQELKNDTILVANIGDFTKQQAGQLRDVGFSGIYHAVRMGEGRDTKIPVKKRLETMRNARENDLFIGTCLEPVGPEHAIEELVEKTLITRDVEPVYSGCARRISLEGTSLSRYGMISEAHMAQFVAVVRLALPLSIPGNCTHEPTILGGVAGANLLWAEMGSNPRDNEQETEKKRGKTVHECRTMLQDAEWKILDGPSRFYQPTRVATVVSS
jgi:biotin synthase